MLRHRSLSRKKFVLAVGLECLASYATTLGLPPPDQLGEDYIECWLGALEDEDRAGVIGHWQTINDICDEAVDCLAAAYSRSALEPDDDAPRERLAMRLFLEDPEAFEVAVHMYEWRNASLSLSHFRLDAVGMLSQWDPDEFQDAVSAHFKQTLRSDRCIVRAYDEAGVRILLVAHGDVQETKKAWTNDGPEPIFLRPARQDVLQYNPTSGVFSMRIEGRAQRADQQVYIDAFSEYCLGVPTRDLAQLETTISLEPIRNGDFSYLGNEHIEWARLMAADLRYAGGDTAAVIRSKNHLPIEMDTTFRGTRIEDAELVFARLHMKVRGQRGGPRSVTLRPPSTSTMSRDRSVIDAYLREQGVLLA